jgi:DNA mismatch repair protein MutS
VRDDSPELPMSPPSTSPSEPPLPAPLSPMMQQYRELKKRYPDYLLLFRLGDFYELFFEDAHEGAALLQITLTSRQKGEGAIPMAGIPHHAADGYIARLIRAGRKVAVCEQMEAPGKGKKIVRREVVRVITPGTLTDTQYLDGAANNFLLALHRAGGSGTRALGAALVDVSTGEFWVGESTARRCSRRPSCDGLRRVSSPAMPSPRWRVGSALSAFP